MTDLPSKIMAWHSNQPLEHVGTWATTRYPEDAEEYVKLADLADMVPDLVWSDWYNGYSIHAWNRLAPLSHAKSTYGAYSIGRMHNYTKSTDKYARAFDSEYSDEWFVECPRQNDLLGPFGNDVSAKKAAQAHHVATILAAFGVQGETA